MKRLLPKLTTLIVLFACLFFFGCKNDSSDAVPVVPTPVAPSAERYSIYTLGQLMGKYGALLEKETTVKQLNKVPNSLTMLYNIPTDKQQDAWLHEAFESGIPIGLLDATEEDLIKFSEFFDLDIDFEGALADNSANPSNVFVARKDDFGNIYSLEAGFDSFSYNDEDEVIGDEEIPADEVLSDEPNPDEGQTSEADFEIAVIKELINWVFVDSPKMIAEASEAKTNANGNTGRASENYDLRKLAAAHSPRIILHASQKHGYKDDLFKFPCIVIDYIIYSLHDFDSNKDYYVMEKNMKRNASPYFEFFDQAPKSNPLKWNKIIHWNSEVTTEAYLDTSKIVRLRNNLPPAGRSYQTFSQTFDWDIGAKINGGYQWGEEGYLKGGVNAGFKFSKSNSWSLKDLEVLPSVGDGRKLNYKYRIPMKDYVPSRNDKLSKVPEIARSTLGTKEMWLWEVEEPGEKLKLRGIDRHTVGRRQYAYFAAGGQRWRYHTQTAEYSIDMRVPPHFTLSTPSRRNKIVLDYHGKLLNTTTDAQIGVFAHQYWTLESNKDWLTPTIPYGTEPKNDVTLGCDENLGKNQRTATLTAKTTIEGKPKVITCEVIQAGHPDGLPDGEVFRVSSSSITVDQVITDPERIKLSAAENWEAESGASWCRIYQFEGGPCIDQEFRIRPRMNLTGSDRSTVVTFTSSSGKTCTVNVTQRAE